MGHSSIKPSTFSILDSEFQEKMSIEAEIRNRLSELQLRRVATGYTHEAAVLMPVFEKDGEPHFLLTRRTEDVQTHKGQISFPGGMCRDDESHEATALRETLEEVGIGEEQIEILGRFHDYLSSTEFRVVPFAGYIAGGFTTIPQIREVAEVLHVPFRTFLDPRLARVEQRLHLGRLVDVYFYSFGPHEIWGLTARIIKDFLEELRGGA